MAVKGIGRTEMCSVHHDKPAVTRCGRCHRPLCASCVVSTNDGKFCSQECALKVADFRKANKTRSTSSSPIKKLVKLVVWVVIIVVILGILNKAVFKGSMPVLGGFLNKLPIIGGTATDAE